MSESAICIGVVSAGAMGSGLARAWRAGGVDVVTTVAGRSPRTAGLAADAGLRLLAGLDEVVQAADLVVSIGPPDQAGQIAASIAAAARRTGSRPLVADLNAVSPQSVQAIATRLADAGLDLVDGSISGGPPRPGGTTRLYLSGSRAQELALVADGLAVRVVGVRIGTASAVKMCTASVFKGFSALLTQALLTAHAHGVEDLVVDDLARDFPDDMARLPRELSVAASKAWRYVGEMREISATQGAAGARPELFDAMAEVWTMVSGRALGQLTPEEAIGPSSLAAVLEDLARVL
ncbi:MAG: DUF1932 domain-containing protein [Jatrophihabitantaceae bacterium]